MAKASKKRFRRPDPSVPMGVPPPPTGAPSAHYPDLGRERPSYDFPPPPPTPPPEKRERVLLHQFDQPYIPTPYYSQMTHPKATVSLVMGIIAVISVIVCLPVGVIIGILAVAFALAALKGIKNEPERYKGGGIAKAGLILGVIGVAITALLLFFLVIITIMPI